MSSDDYLGVLRDGDKFTVVHGFASEPEWPEPKDDAPRFDTLEEAVSEAARIEASWSLGAEYGIIMHTNIDDPTYLDFGSFEYGSGDCETCGWNVDELRVERVDGTYEWVDSWGCYGGERFETQSATEMLAHAIERSGKFKPEAIGPVIEKLSKHAEVVGER